MAAAAARSRERPQLVIPDTDLPPIDADANLYALRLSAAGSIFAFEAAYAPLATVP